MIECLEVFKVIVIVVFERWYGLTDVKQIERERRTILGLKLRGWIAYLRSLR